MTESLLILAADAPSKNMLVWLGVAFAALLIFLFITALIIKQYKRCPSNRVLVIFGRGCRRGDRAPAIAPPPRHRRSPGSDRNSGAGRRP